MECECKNWARTTSWLTEHHPTCPKVDVEGDAIKLITALVRGIETWASDEDGVHEHCWHAYSKAKFVIGEKITTSNAADGGKRCYNCGSTNLEADGICRDC